MARKVPHEDHVNHEAWAIPYGDLITLLLAFFVVMYAVSSVNEGKYRVAAASMSAAFGGTPKSPQPIQIGDNLAKGQKGERPAPPSAAPQFQSEATEFLSSAPLAAVLREARPVSAQLKADGDAALARINDVLTAALAPLIEQNWVRVTRKTWWLEVEINSDLLFASGASGLQPEVLPVIDELGEILSGFDNRLRIEGHTDDRPIHTSLFPSNWELSAARAGTVVRRLRDRGVAAERLSVVGYGEFRPVDDNASEAGRRANRRVTIVILAAEAEQLPLNSAGVSAHAS
ncbi:flagellar motor protein MotD [Flagellatimonas centrodinii]|uniref:flagellar motor protein MotD n=1 Tax=Flagellatimonas centrodinii TaxID=2806210 RepID=UPI001FED6A97|nr:flagellar motor protein MotD [Flagellatimonas centrodinii]ULQ45660.1 flagellar motor protein MotD [Flagellatimonas centrodinii]